MKRSNIKNKGFTLIELLIVVMLIGTLSAIVVSIVNGGGFRSKAKDSQRIADLEKIRSALELYFADNREYPDSSGWKQVTGEGFLSGVLEPDYLNKVPSDPSGESGGNTGPCSSVDFNRYNYNAVSSGGGYVLTSIMEIDSSNDGNECSSLNNWNGSWCSSFATSDFCYGVENP